jgi:hypothetical protein
MNPREPLLSRNKRRAIYWLLLFFAILAPLAFTIMASSQSGVIFGLNGFDLLRISGAAHAFLLIWCVLFIGVEPLLARCVLIYIALLHVLFFAGLTEPVF